MEFVKAKAKLTDKTIMDAAGDTDLDKEKECICTKGAFQTAVADHTDCNFVEFQDRFIQIWLVKRGNL